VSSAKIEVERFFKLKWSGLFISLKGRHYCDSQFQINLYYLAATFAISMKKLKCIAHILTTNTNSRAR